MARKYTRDFTAYFKNHVNNEPKKKKQKEVYITTPPSLLLENLTLKIGGTIFNVQYNPAFDTAKDLVERLNNDPSMKTLGFKASLIGLDPYKQEEIKQLTTEQQQLNQSVMQLKEVLRKKFINVDEVAEILEIGFVANKNVFLYGRGGHAKSEIIQEFLKYVDPTGENSFVQACGEGLSEEKLFGGLNLQKFQQTGEIEYLVENSFMNKKFVVFEELLDSRMNVLLSLKDILTSGIFRQGKQQFKIKTEFVICLTNRTKQEVAEDNSIKALLERFPLEMKVEWERYEAQDYMNMFHRVLGDTMEKVAGICQTINESGDFISPRTAIHMGQVFQKTGTLSALKYFGATKDIIEKVEKIEREREQAQYIETKKKEFERILNNNPCDCMDAYKQGLKDIRFLIEQIVGNTYVDKVFPAFNDLKTKAEAKIDEYKNEMLNIIENE